jgi:hypothetical protein
MIRNLMIRNLNDSESQIRNQGSATALLIKIRRMKNETRS